MVIIIFFSLILGGCTETKPERKDLSSIALTSDDIDPSLTPHSEDHIKTPYIVEEGKLFEGMLVREKYEIVFMKTSSYFIVQQLAILNSTEDAVTFLSTLQESDTLPGVISDYYFTSVPMDQLGDQSVLKTNSTVIDGNQTQLYMLIFRKDATVCILVSGSLEEDIILSYGSILEERLLTL
jgi:hypothetical protein